MHPLHDGGFVVDTPGIRDVGLWAIDARELGEAFPEFAPHVALCRFDDCRHVEEPGCGVTAAAERGEIHSTRLDSYRRFLEEAVQASRHWE
jgi:ribosome biogenesis GTPase